jgi:ribosomal protein S18 acetylase RimI-like enzyme
MMSGGQGDERSGKMLIRKMTGEDAEAVSALVFRSYDQVLVHYQSPEVLASFREHETPEGLRQQLGRKQLFVAEDAGRVVAVGGLGWMDAPYLPREVQAEAYAPGADRRITNLFVAVDLIGRGIGRMLLDHLVALAQAAGARRLHVASAPNAVSFYERAGFTIDPDPPVEIPEITWLVREF